MRLGRGRALLGVNLLASTYACDLGELSGDT